MEAFQKSDIDERISALGRQATVLKNEGDWNGAVVYLREMRQLMVLETHMHYTNDHWCRLALVLQQAGRFEESMQEFDWLEADIERRARKEAFLDNPNVSFGKNTSKKSVFNRIVKQARKDILINRGLARTREERRLAKLQKLDGSAK